MPAASFSFSSSFLTQPMGQVQSVWVLNFLQQAAKVLSLLLILPAGQSSLLAGPPALWQQALVAGSLLPMLETHLHASAEERRAARERRAVENFILAVCFVLVCGGVKM